MSVYLDYAATTPVDPRVVEAMSPCWTEQFGNSSSGHVFGQNAKHAIEQARHQVATLLGADKKEILFTSSGTESDNTAIKAVCSVLQEKGNHIIISPFEHKAVSKPVEFLIKQGFKYTLLPVSSNGIVNPDDLNKIIRKETTLVSVMHANNEIGTLQPIKVLAEIAHDHGCIFHTDAVQTAGHIPINVRELDVDLMSISAHKFYGPKGVGALYIKDGTPYESLLHGGSHESGRRASTVNTPGIVGMGKAAEISIDEMDEEAVKIKGLRDLLWNKIQSEIEGVHLNGDWENRLANNLNISIDKVEGEAMFQLLDMAGIAVSSGSACSSGSGKPSHVLTAIGLNQSQAQGSLRITLGRYTTEDELNVFVKELRQTVRKLRDLGSL